MKNIITELKQDIDRLKILNGQKFSKVRWDYIQSLETKLKKLKDDKGVA